MPLLLSHIHRTLGLNMAGQFEILEDNKFIGAKDYEFINSIIAFDS